MDILRRYFTLPTFADEENQVRARVMYIIFAAMIIFGLVIVAIGLAIGGVQPVNLGMGVVLVFIIAGLLWLLCRGFVTSVVWSYSLLMMGGATLAVYNVGTIYTYLLAMYLFSITLAGLLLNTRIAVGFLVLSVVIIGGLSWAEGQGMLPSPSHSPAGPYIILMAVGGFIIVVQHLTQRGLANALDHVRDVTAQQNAVLDSAAMGIVLMVDRKFVWANPRMEGLFGYAEDELVGQTSEMLYPSPRDYEELGEEAYPLLAQAQSYNAERLMKRKDGSEFWCSLTGRAVNPDDLSQGAIWTLEDVTERKEAERERERLQDEVIEAQQQAIKELSTPVIPLMEGVIVMPLVGSIDTLRARDVTRSLLAGISEHQAKVVIVDITGVAVVDTGVVNYLNKTIQTARLRGARTIVTGISDAVAETIVELGIDWSNIETLRDLQSGLAAALGRSLHYA
jgi:PAS domain S-box-containing protein